MKLTDKNLKEAYCKVLVCTGLGAATNNCEELMDKNVLVTVPEPMHDDYPARLLACAIQICADESYGWAVKDEEPIIDKDMTFYLLWYNWFLEIISN